MTALTHKQRVKVNAALALIHDAGHDAQAVVNLARDYLAIGHDARRAYESALGDFAATAPGLAPALGRITRLIEASDPATVAKYDVALTAFIDTGDAAAINALGPMIAADSIALAKREGEVPEGMSDADSLAAALGIEATPEAVAYAGLAAPSAASPAPASPSRMIGLGDAPAAPDTAYQVSPFEGGGYRAPKAQARWADIAPVGFVPTRPNAAPGTTVEQAYAAAKASVNERVSTTDLIS